MIKADISRNEIKVEISGKWTDIMSETMVFIDDLLEAVPDNLKDLTYKVLSSYLRDKSTGKIDEIEKSIESLLDLK